ncbi:hypothetical protein LTR08_009168 [Meristemomyces frigidus]|nr:hypothetical protein LTR08_009168 [Meristemomyces frigidus]
MPLTFVQTSSSIWNLPGPVASLAFSTAAIFTFTRRSLHPVYSLCVAIFFFPGWVTTVTFVYANDRWAIQEKYAGLLGVTYHPYPTPGLVVVKDICFGVVTLTYLVYIGFAAKAVEDLRRRKLQGIIELDDGMGIELVAKKADPEPGTA